MVMRFQTLQSHRGSQPHRKRAAFTLVELLVVIAIIGILIALLLPAVQAAREAARRSQCTNNLKQLGLAVHNYHDSYNVIPPVSIWSSSRSTHWGWGTMLLPFVEQTALYDQLSPDGGPLPTAADQPLLLQTLAVYNCPSDIGDETNRYYNNLGKTNYLGSQGAFFAPYLKGMYSKPATFAAFLDGTSNTILIGERFLDTGGNPWKSTGGVWAGRGGGSNAQIQGRGAWPPNTPFVGPADEDPNGATDPLGTRTAWTSLHPGGVNLVFCDGSVHFISENIDSLTSYSHSRYTNFYRITEQYSEQEANRVYQNLFRPDDRNPVSEF